MWYTFKILHFVRPESKHYWTKQKISTNTHTCIYVCTQSHTQSISDSFIYSFTLFSVYSYTGKYQGCGNCQSSCINIC